MTFVIVRDMRFLWDWLRPVISVPYVPTLGPVQPGALSAELFNAVAGIAGTRRFLPYDKDGRWFRRKDERLLVDEIIHTPDRTVVPTLSRAGSGLIKIHHYSPRPPEVDEVAQWARQWHTTYRAASSKLLWFQESPERARGRLMLKTFSNRDLQVADRVCKLSNCDVADTFPAFAEQFGVDGFSFLHQRIKAGHADGPILVTVEDRRIVGAVGPLSILTDAGGAIIQPPQYFAVHPAHRQRGHGRALWRAAMAWGRSNGAEYKVLQASVGSAAERLYLSEGLTTLGFVCTRDLTLTPGRPGSSR